MKKIFVIEKGYSHKTITLFGIKLKIKNKNFLGNNSLQKYISNEIFAANCIKEMHCKTFPKYKNCHKNDEIVIAATGPTLNYYSPINAVHIGVNRAYKTKNIKFDYLFMVDYAGTNKENIDEIVKYPANIFLGTYYSTRPDVKKHNIPVKYKEMPNVNSYAVDVSRNLCYPDLECCGLMDFGSVVFNAIHFATYTHPKKIYLVGCDCVDSGHFDNSPPYTDPNIARIRDGWKYFKEYQQIYYPDIEIISINPVGLRGLFKDVYTQDYLEKHKELSGEQTLL